jgi:hypothetical protein
MVVLAVAGVLVVAALALARRPSPPAGSAAAKTQAEALAQTANAATAAPADARPAPLASPVPVAPVARPRVSRAVEKPRQILVATTTSSPDFVPSPPPAVGAASGAGESTVGSEPASSASAANSDAISQMPVTITGCLESTVDLDRFRLTDTEGADAPKARSWRSGFLKKRSAPVELLELSDRPALREYVGHRVVATGLLTSRELRVRSLQSAGSGCH